MSRLPVLWLDLDGTLLNPWPRQWAAYTRTCRDLGLAPILRSRFKALKRRGPLAAKALLGALDDASKARFKQVQLAWIEHPDLLALDRPFPGTAAFLAWAGKRYELKLATARTSATKTEAQLRRLKLRDCFRSVMVTNGQAGRPRSKAELALRQRGPCVWIGDTEAEAEAAKQARSPFLACVRGMRDQAFLRRLKPACTYSGYGELRHALALIERTAKHA